MNRSCYARCHYETGVANVFLFSCSRLSGRKEEGGSAWETDERDEQGRVRDEQGGVRNSRREELGGGGECDGARQSRKDEGVGDEGEESVRQTDDDRNEETE